MKIRCSLLLVLISFFAHAQQDTAAPGKMHLQHAAYTQHSITVTAALGIVDAYRHNYTLPPAFEKNNTTGFAPLYARVETGISKHVSLAATFGYDAFSYNFNQVYQGYNGPILRYRSNNTRIISGGLAGYYHFINPFHVSRLDLFVGLGLSLTNVRYGAYPDGDSTLVKLEHNVLPVAKIGARYYMNDIFSVYGDAGFDGQSIASVGISCRFFRKGRTVTQ